MIRCNGLFGIHRFEPRYDLSPANMKGQMAECAPSDAIAMMDRFRAQTYVCDICVRCGTVISRQSLAKQD